MASQGCGRAPAAVTVKVEGISRPSVRRTAVAVISETLCVFKEFDAEVRKVRAEAAGGGGGGAGEGRAAVEEGDGGGAALGAEGVGHGHGELGAADARADHGDGGGAVSGEVGGPAGGVGAEGFGGDTVVGKALSGQGDRR